MYIRIPKGGGVFIAPTSDFVKYTIPIREIPVCLVPLQSRFRFALFLKEADFCPILPPKLLFFFVEECFVEQPYAGLIRSEWRMFMTSETRTPSNASGRGYSVGPNRASVRSATFSQFHSKAVRNLKGGCNTTYFNPSRSGARGNCNAFLQSTGYKHGLLRSSGSKRADTGSRNICSELRSRGRMHGEVFSGADLRDHWML